MLWYVYCVEAEWSLVILKSLRNAKWWLIKEGNMSELSIGYRWYVLLAKQMHRYYVSMLLLCHHLLTSNTIRPAVTQNTAIEIIFDDFMKNC